MIEKITYLWLAERRPIYRKVLICTIECILVPRAHDHSDLRQGSSSGFLQHLKSAIHGLPVKSGKSDWLKIWNDNSAHAQSEATKKWKILNKRYLWKYWSGVLQTWHHKCASQKKQNQTLSAVSMATISALVSFYQKTKCPHLQPLKWDRGFYLKQT